MDLRGGMPYTYMLENFFPDLRSSLSVVCYRKPEPPVKSFPKRVGSERTGTGPATR